MISGLSDHCIREKGCSTKASNRPADLLTSESRL
ncbi:uncharacterized protein J3R85_018346 [Psidium guajava]|nr:uncharacterized protein J3R85_018346 [Psidium guajava]